MEFVAGIFPRDNVADGFLRLAGIALGQKMRGFVLVFKEARG